MTANRIGGSTTTYTSPDDFRSGIPGLSMEELMVTSSQTFRARVTSVRMPHFTLALVDDAAPCIAFMSFAPTLTFLTFPLRGNLIWNGVSLQRGEFALQGHGKHLHQRTESPTSWGLLSVKTRYLSDQAQALLGSSLSPTSDPQFLRPPGCRAGTVLRLHARISRLAAKDPAMLFHREVARAIEHELLHAVVNAIAESVPSERTDIARRQAEIMLRFNRRLGAQVQGQSLSSLCATIGVPERTLRELCKRFFGLSPLRYARLRRLNLARSALATADRRTESVAAIARKVAFMDSGRFAVAYRALFGESPSATLKRNSAESVS